MAIDFHIHTLRYQDKQEIHLEDSYLVMASSPRSHRHRKGEIFACLMDFNMPSQITGEEQRQMLQRAGKTFFDTPGSVTNAIQSAAAALNTALLQMNLAPDAVETLSVAVNFAVYHQGYVFLAQSGMVHTLVFTREGTTHFSSTDPNERGLGSSRRFYLNYKQVAIQSGDVLILSTKQPDTWDEERLRDSHVISMEQLHRRLTNQLSDDVTAVFIKCREGRGTVHEETWNLDESTLFAEKPPERSAQPERSIQESEETAEMSLDGELPSESRTELDHPLPIPESIDSFSEEEPVAMDKIPVQAGETEKAGKVSQTEEETKRPAARKERSPRENPLQQSAVEFGRKVQRSSKNLFKKLGA
jgi:hypothetical protein